MPRVWWQPEHVMSLSRRSKPAERADVLQTSRRVRPPSSTPRRRRFPEIPARPLRPPPAPGRRPAAGSRPQILPGSAAIAPVARNSCGIRIVPRSSSAKCAGSSSHALKSRLSFSSRQNPVAIDLVLKRRFLERPGLRDCNRTPSGDSRCGNREPAISAHARSEDWFRCAGCSRGRIRSSGPSFAVNFSANSAPVSGNSPAESQRRAISGAGDRHAAAVDRLIAFRPQHDIERHRQPRRGRAIAG